MRSPEIEAEAERLLGELTDDELVDLVSGSVDFWEGMGDLFGGGYHRHPWPAAAVERLGVDGIRFIDGPRGVVIGRATCFPVAMARGAAWDVELEERIGDAIGVEHRSLGGNLYGGVCVNLLRHPAWGRAQETYGEDPHHLGELGAALTRGVQRHVMACVKHFACNSMENARFQVDVEASPRALHELYLPHFRRIVEEGVASVMSAYNSLNGEWCGQSPALLGGVLKQRWGFTGFVLTDFIFGLRDAVAGMQAGQDLEMPFRNLYHRHLRPALADGSVSRPMVEDAARRILRQQVRFAGVGEPERYGDDAVASAEHRALARLAATESMVLLRNEMVGGRPVLPLDAAVLHRVALLGQLAAVPNLGDRGSSEVLPPEVITPLDGLRGAIGTAVEVVHCDGEDLGEAARVAGAADVAVVVVGCTAADEGEYVTPDLSELFPLFPPAPEESGRPEPARGEGRSAGFGAGGDRAGLALSPAHQALVEGVAAANQHTVVVLMGGSAMLTTLWQERVPAIVMAWYPGMEGGAALADLLLGAASPTGRLPFSWPATEADLPPFDLTARSVTYDLWHGYRLADRDGTTPAYPFGFGLGYTTVEYRSLTIAGDEVTASEGVARLQVTVANTGDRPTAEVVQVYAAPIGPPVERAVKHLVAFARVPLQPGQEQTVTLAVPVARLARFDEQVDDFVVDPGTWDLRAGPHAGSQPLTVRLTVT